MSQPTTTAPKEQRKRDEETRLNASHLSQPVTTKEEDEDWGDVTPKAEAKAPSHPKDEDLEQELAAAANRPEDEEDEEDEEEEVLVTDPVIENVDVAAAMQKYEQLHSEMRALEGVFIKGLQNKLVELNAQRKKLDDEEHSIRTKIAGLSKGQPAVKHEDGTAPKRRGRKKASLEGVGSSTATASTTSTDEAAPGRGGRGKRFRNDHTLKQMVCKALLVMTHNGKPYTGQVNDVANKVTLPVEQGGLGYRSTSANRTNTVRIQIYRLEEDGKVIKNEDGSFSLRRETVKELTGADPIFPEVPEATA